MVKDPTQEQMKTPQISDQQWKILSVIWESYPMTAREIVEKMGLGEEEALNNVKVQLSRLIEKGAISKTRDGRELLYSPILNQRDLIKAEAERLSDKLPNSGLSGLISHFLKLGKLSKRELSEISDLIEKAEEDTESK